ncbi:histone-like nucleoid-structuring protein, MvaT/MvaU family [Halomonas sp. WWR20]
MSKLFHSYQEKQRLVQQLSEELKQMEDDNRLKQEIEFKEKLEGLMTEFNKSAKDVLDILNPGQEPVTPEKAAGRRKRKLKIYENPHTKEIVKTRGGNQKTLKAWKDEHGAETVENWLVREEG